MDKTHEQQQAPDFDTSHPFAFLFGWLALPAAYSLFTFFGAIIMLTVVDPTPLSGFDNYIYWMDVIFLPILVIIYIFWWKRKKALPYLMVLFFFFVGIREVIYLMGDAGISYFNIVLSIVWIGYFLKSKRVKQTFIR